jgi:hypothetical protein
MSRYSLVREPPAIYLNVEYAGAAPTLLSGIDQMNVTLPAIIPQAYGYPPGTVPLQVFDPGKASYQVVTIYAAVPPAPSPTSDLGLPAPWAPPPLQ